MFYLILDFIKHIFNVYGVVSKDGPPSTNAVAGWAVLNKAVMEKQCPICLREYWGRETKNFNICGRFSCYRKSKNIKKLRHQL